MKRELVLSRFHLVGPTYGGLLKVFMAFEFVTDVRGFEYFKGPVSYTGSLLSLDGVKARIK